MSDDDERLRNLLMCKIYATNSEIEEMAPYILIVALVIGLIAISCCCLKKENVNTVSIQQTENSITINQDRTILEKEE